MIKGHTIKRILPVFILLLPVAAWAFIKPLRILAPEMAGVSCASSTFCIDDTSRIAETKLLYDEALAFVDAEVGEIKRPPLVIFCATRACYQSFGFDHSAANTIASFGIIIGPRGWQPHYVRHELIHHLQRERLGTFKAWFMMPDWFSEGMAYDLSDDPRVTLSPPFQQYRSRFHAWYENIGNDRLWDAASNL